MTAFAALVGAWAIWNFIPFQHLSEPSQAVISLFRIVFSLLLILRLWRSEEALPMLWGWQKTSRLKLLWKIWYAILIALALGLFTPIMAIANFLMIVFIFRTSFYYSIEDIYFQIVSFGLVFLNSGAYFSLDQALGFPLLLPDSIALTGLNLLVWVVALSVMSAGFEKSLSPVWQRGLGFYYFVALPHFVRHHFRFIRRHKRLCLNLGYATVVGQLLLLPSLPIPFVRDFFLMEQLIFGVLLFVIVDLSFIPQIYTLQFSLFLVLDIIASISPTSTGAFPAQDVGQIAFLVLAIFLWIASSIQAFGISLPLQTIASIPVRLTTGITSFRVFTEAHLFGLYVYRLVARLDGNEIPLLSAFDGNGFMGPYQNLYPRYFQGAMYPITDVCIARRLAPDQEPRKLSRLVDLCYAAIQSKAGCRHQCCSVELQVKAINPDEDYVATSDHWIDTSWTPIGECKVMDGNPHFQWLNMPPTIHKIARPIPQ